ncbi:GTPase activating factor [Mycoemilia scoparia]|uniref:GTPase activating factor n=1 Tax=Mycoemilia scoparia TaxID=417184 RepID=A0A9W7ZXG0_9FUNG|nr:GTPase activating factor [Mycoemilia scoparia]
MAAKVAAIPTTTTSFWDVIDISPQRLDRLETQYNALVEINTMLEEWVKCTKEWSMTFSAFRRSLHGILSSLNKSTNASLPHNALYSDPSSSSEHDNESLKDSRSIDGQVPSATDMKSVDDIVGALNEDFNSFIVESIPSLDAPIDPLHRQLESVKQFRETFFLAIQSYKETFKAKCDTVGAVPQDSLKLEANYIESVEKLMTATIDYQSSMKTMRQISGTVVEEKISTFLLNMQEWFSTEDCLFIGIKNAYDNSLDQSNMESHVDANILREQIELMRLHTKTKDTNEIVSTKWNSFIQTKRSGYLMYFNPSNSGNTEDSHPWRREYFTVSPDSDLQILQNSPALPKEKSRDTTTTTTESFSLTTIAHLKDCKVEFGSYEGRDNVLRITLANSDILYLQSPSAWEASAWMNGIQSFTDKKKSLEIISKGQNTSQPKKSPETLTSELVGMISKIKHHTSLKRYTSIDSQTVPMMRDSTSDERLFERQGSIGSVAYGGGDSLSIGSSSRETQKLGNFANQAIFKTGKLRLLVTKTQNKASSLWKLAENPLVNAKTSKWLSVVATLKSTNNSVLLTFVNIDDGSLIGSINIDRDAFKTHFTRSTDPSLFNSPYCFYIKVPSSPAGHGKPMTSFDSGGSSSIISSASSSQNDVYSLHDTVVFLSCNKASDRDSWISIIHTFSNPCIYGPITPLKDIPTQESNNNNNNDPAYLLPTAATTTATSNRLNSYPLKFRVERMLWLRLKEARYLFQNGNYYAALNIDGLTMAKSEVKKSTNWPKWESCVFFLGGLDDIRDGAALQLYNQQGGHSRASTNIKDEMVGYAFIPIPSMQRNTMYEGWYPVLNGPQPCDEGSGIDSTTYPLGYPIRKGSADNIGRDILPRMSNTSNSGRSLGGSSSKSSSQLRSAIPQRAGDLYLRVRYDELIVLDSPHYAELNTIITDFSKHPLIYDLSLISKSKDWLVETFIKILLAQGKVVGWISSLIKTEIAAQTIHDPVLLFRGSSVCTRAVESFMKLLGTEFVDDMIGNVIREVIEKSIVCEVDPTRLKAGESTANGWNTLLSLMDKLWRSIERAKHKCPFEMQKIFSNLRQTVQQHYGSDNPNVKYSCITGFLFLRFVCPAIMSPMNFGIIESKPEPKVQRTLTLIAKGLQSLANLSEFGLKEPYMQPMNGFVKQCIPYLKSFVDEMATSSSKSYDPSAAYPGSGRQYSGGGYSGPGHNTSSLTGGGIPRNDTSFGLIDVDRELASLCQYVNSHSADIELLSTPVTTTGKSSAPFISETIHEADENMSESSDGAITTPISAPVCGSENPLKDDTNSSHQNTKNYQQVPKTPSLFNELITFQHRPSNTSGNYDSMVSSPHPDNSPISIFGGGGSVSINTAAATGNGFADSQQVQQLVKACYNIQEMVTQCKNSNTLPPVKLPFTPSTL